ncbi:MAG: sulfite exporter TauE/SafE family protein [Deltaproteobacteria bacterium]|nr:sulfite exporter TauE/SafE family protein [Deltaproteobacteria bacterium]
MIFPFEKYLGLIAMGFGVGAYGTLIGAGGGFVLMPILLLLYPDRSPELLTSISLAVVFFNAASGSEAYALMKRIDYKSGFLFALATIPGSIIGAMNTSIVPRRIFDIIFSVLLIFASIFLVLRSGPAKETRKEPRTLRHKILRSLVDSHGIIYEYEFNPYLGVVLSVFVGYLSSFLGIGGGIIHVPILSYFLGFPVHIATATSHFILAIMALTGTMVHIFKGTFHQGVHMTVSLAIGVVIGAQLGAHLSERIKGEWIIRGLSIALGLVGLRILMLVLW